MVLVVCVVGAVEHGGGRLLAGAKVVARQGTGGRLRRRVRNVHAVLQLNVLGAAVSFSCG